MDWEEEQYNKPFDWKVWAKVLPFFKPYRGLLVRLCILIALVAGGDGLLPLIQKYAIDHFIVPRTTQGVWPLVAACALVFALAAFCIIRFVWLSMRIELFFARDLRSALFRHLQTLSLDYYNTTPVGYLIARVMSDTERIGEVIAWGAGDVLWGLAYLVMVTAVMLAMNWRLALVVIVMFPLIALCTMWFQSRMLRYNRHARHVNSLLTGAFNEGVIGARTSKTLVIEDVNDGNFRSLSGKMKTAAIRAASISALYMPVVSFFGVLAVAIILVYGSGLVSIGQLPLGTLSAMISYGMGVFEPIQNLARTFTGVVATQANIERITALAETKPLITDRRDVIERYGDSFTPKRENWEKLEGHVTFEDVTFRYHDGNRDVLEHFNLDVPAGQTVAIVGDTGAGKSTLVNLVCRFLEPTGGRILIDGKDIRDRSMLWLHSNIGYVLQSPHLFSGTIRDNIRYGRPDASDEDIKKAASLVCADAVIAKLEQGLDTDVGEGGDLLSTGEKQLISFARAVIADPRIFVLDEATSSIDTQTERLIQNAISNILVGRTSFIVAHRLSTIRMADQILVVQGGEIIEQGTHDGLLAADGYYAHLYRKQFEM
ncbi:MAG: ABC transporter ATP-binding protein/permease [Lachnospiraceae bacterium]|jgi:ATP-binding cassette subfamily B protein|nr:ABC transporter ATP-binding protein/permease [Lachnospiraceae bacterium]